MWGKNVKCTKMIKDAAKIPKQHQAHDSNVILDVVENKKNKNKNPTRRLL